MALRPTASQARQFAQLVDRLKPEVRQAFMRAVVDLHANVDWPALLAALESGNTFAAIQALNVTEAAFSSYSQALTNAFLESGTATAQMIVATKQASIGLRFNMQNPRAQEWIRNNVGNKITGYVQDQILAARTVIESGYAAGNHPHTIARELVGRVGTGGVRQGGILGLDGPRAARLDAVTNGMKTADGVQGLVVDGRVRYKVNKATEDKILRAYRNGTAVPARERVIAERQYSNALLKDRADTVAATETSQAVMSARNESWEQAAEEQGLDSSQVEKTWRHRRGSDGRQTHIEMAGVKVMGLDTPFILSDGSVMQYAHDPAGGAKNNINCGCDTEYRLVRRVS